MRATTIKLDPKLHSAIKRMKPRELAAREEKKRAPESAADAYASLLKGNKDEGAWLASWESAPLASALKRRKT